jgi:predicted  nucleic acid-binding Zn-ribbon protein
VKHGIDTDVQLSAHKDGLTAQINTLYDQRRHLRNFTRGVHDEDELEAVKAEISGLSDQMKDLRREVRLCDDIDRRSADMREKLQRARDEEKSDDKETKKDAQFRRRR